MKYHLFLIIGLVFLTDLCDTLGQLILKHTVNAAGVRVAGIKDALRFVFSLLKIFRVWIGSLLSLISLVIWLFVLSKSDLNLAFSLDSMRYLLIAASSAVILKEKISGQRWAGIACVIAGIILISCGA